MGGQCSTHRDKFSPVTSRKNTPLWNTDVDRRIILNRNIAELGCKGVDWTELAQDGTNGGLLGISLP
jgi:hypothetical protein